jgi:hypothetical protein
MIMLPRRGLSTTEVLSPQQKETCLRNQSSMATYISIEKVKSYLNLFFGYRKRKNIFNFILTGTSPDIQVPIRRVGSANELQVTTGLKHRPEIVTECIREMAPAPRRGAEVRFYIQFKMEPGTARIKYRLSGYCNSPPIADRFKGYFIIS